MGQLNQKILVMFLLIVAAVFIVAAAPQNATAAETVETEATILEVNGEGKIEVKPDRARVSFGVETTGKTAVEAQQENNILMNRVIERLKDGGFLEENMQTRNLSVVPQYNYAEENRKEPEIIGYLASNEISLQVTDVRLVGKSIDLAIEAGANEVRGVQFSLNNEREVRNQALELAVRDAKSQADAVAAVLGMEVNRIRTVRIGGVYLPRPVYMEGMGAAEEAKMLQAPIMPGNITVSAQVFIVYELK